MSRTVLNRLLLFWAALLGCSLLLAQAPTGSLVGSVSDSTGARLAGASIQLQSSEFSTRRRVTADAKGQYHVAALQPGNYILTVSKPGFKSAKQSIQILVSTPVTANVTLQPAAMNTMVTVEGTPSSVATEPIDTTNAVHEAVITAQDLAKIPLPERSFANIAYMAPGTEPVEPSDPTKARITAVSTGGSSGLNNSLSVDGADNTDYYIGGFLQNFSPDAVQEFAFKTAGEDADVGGTTAGAVVITTKRGTNQYHGLLAFYERAAALNARFPIDNPAPNPKQPFSRQNYVGNVGGPMGKNLYFFGSLEDVDERASIAYSPTNQTQFNALAQLAAQGLIPNVSSINVPSSVPVPFKDLLGDFRIDWNQSERSQWFFRVSSDDYTTDNSLVQQGALPSTGATSHSRYFDSVLSNTFVFNPNWLGTLTLGQSYLHATVQRNQYLGYALAFPFTSTANIISGFETFGDNQFVTPITAFPVERNQEEYQLRYDVTDSHSSHTFRFGGDFLHQPVLSGALSGTAENLTTFAMNPTAYLNNAAQFSADLNCAPNATPGTACSSTPAGNGSFSQNVQRLGVYAQDTWQVSPSLTVDYGLRWDTTFGLFQASNRSQLDNPAYLTLKALQIPLVNGAPHDFRKAFAPRLGFAYGFGKKKNNVFRAGFGLYFDDLAQNGWVGALSAVNSTPAPCNAPGDAGCLPGAANGGSGAMIDPSYETPYAIHILAGWEHAFSSNWAMDLNYTHEEGNHAYRAYTYEPGYSLFSPLFAQDVATQQANVPVITLTRTDNRSRYDALMEHLQGTLGSHATLVVNYTLSRGDTWGCILGELFDYVNGVCNPLNAFGPGDFGPSGEDVTHRLVLMGTFDLPGGVELSPMFQAESARPFTMTTPVDVLGTGNPVQQRAVVNGKETTLDQFRGTPYNQLDMRIARPFSIKDRWTAMPFIEMFNVYNRNNPGAFYATNISGLPLAVNNPANATAICTDASCSSTVPITNLNQLKFPAGAFGDFFGPGTTVGIPFAAQLGVRVTF